MFGLFRDGQLMHTYPNFQTAFNALKMRPYRKGLMVKRHPETRGKRVRIPRALLEELVHAIVYHRGEFAYEGSNSSRTLDEARMYLK